MNNKLAIIPLFIFLATTMNAQTTLKFGDDLQFLKQHTDVVVLSDKDGNAQVAVVPAYQGRIMTSTAGGPAGTSFGWVNRDLIASGKFQQHTNVFGGEDRFWLGPEGGQFSIFFAKGVTFDLEHWFTPAPIDTEPFKVVKKSATSITCEHRFSVANYTGTKFDLAVTREVRLLSPAIAAKHLKTKLGAGIKVVAFESVNTVQNTGTAAWTKDTGLLSIWMLGMLNASPATTVVIPFQTGPTDTLGPIVNDAYFGKVPTERLIVKEDKGVLFFAADAQCRSKIGLSPQRCKPTLGSYDAVNKVLTIVQFTQPKGATEYVNSMWEIQKEPFAGDVANSYNDNGKMGQFYELESSSPALALEPKASATHTHRTIHLQGNETALSPISQTLLGVSLDEIKTSLRK